MAAWLIVAGDIAPPGGMDRANHALASFLAREGRDVHLVAHRVAPDLASRANVTVHHVPRPAGHLAGAPWLARTAERWARRLGPRTRLLGNGGNCTLRSVTWIHFVHAACDPVVAGSLRTRVSAAVGRPYYLARERAALSRAALAICNSARTAGDVQRLFGMDAARTRVVQYGTDAAAFGPVTPEERRTARAALGWDAGRPVALFIGALGDRRKGFDVLFDAWRSLCEEAAWDVDLAVAGAGGEAAAWQARAARAGLGARIRFLSYRGDIERVIAAADVLVHPSRYEPYGLGVHEAICRGLPAIVCSGAGVAEQFDERTRPMLVTDPPRADAIVEALRRWRGAPDDWKERFAPLSSRLRARSWDDMASDIAALVEATA
jgi:glycosyltransferase involved in cell wall biosynthesis